MELMGTLMLISLIQIGPSTVPDVEDIRDNTMNTINAYYEYSIDVQPNMTVGQNYITDTKHK
jgi:cell surface protein SprA